MALVREKGQPWAGSGAQEQLQGPRPPPLPRPGLPGSCPEEEEEIAHFLNMRAKREECRPCPRGSPERPRGPQPGPSGSRGPGRGPCRPLAASPCLPLSHSALPTLQSWLCLAPDPGRQGQGPGASRVWGHAGVSHQQELGFPGPQGQDQAFPRGRNHASVCEVGPGHWDTAQDKTRISTLGPTGRTNVPTHTPPPSLQTGEAGMGRRAGAGRPNKPAEVDPTRGQGGRERPGPRRGLRGGGTASTKALGREGRPGGHHGSGVSRHEQRPGVQWAASAPLARWANTRWLGGGKRESPADHQPLPEPAPSSTTLV